MVMAGAMDGLRTGLLSVLRRSGFIPPMGERRWFFWGRPWGNPDSGTAEKVATIANRGTDQDGQGWRRTIRLSARPVLSASPEGVSG